jgi:hypothetical protein
MHYAPCTMHHAPCSFRQVGREAWLLEARVVALELCLAQAELAGGVTVMANGLRCAGGGGSQVLQPAVAPAVECRAGSGAGAGAGRPEGSGGQAALPPRGSWRTRLSLVPAPEGGKRSVAAACREDEEPSERSRARRTALLAVRRKSSGAAGLQRRTRRDTLNSDSEVTSPAHPPPPSPGLLQRALHRRHPL